MTRLLLDTSLDRDQAKYAETVKASGDALLSLINDILDFSKIEAGQLEIETIDFDLQSLVDDFAALMAHKCQEKGLEFIYSLDSDVPVHVQGDPGRLRQVLLNLTGNATKFTERGEVVIKVTKDAEVDGVVTLRFHVTDTGSGIPQDQLARLFLRFEQADGSTTRRHGVTVVRVSGLLSLNSFAA